GYFAWVFLSGRHRANRALWRLAARHASHDRHHRTHGDIHLFLLIPALIYSIYGYACIWPAWIELGDRLGGHLMARMGVALKQGRARRHGHGHYRMPERG